MSIMSGCADFLITRDTMIPDLLSQYPKSRSVLDSMGLRGCGGPLGPYETLGYFARAHGIDESKMLSEIRAVIEGDDSSTVIERTADASPVPGIADAIYRPYFAAGILTILTVGATWGAVLLWRIAVGHSFQSAAAMEINAHAQAQVYGWMGFFIMGFAYQAFPRFWHSSLVKPRLALIVFSFLFVGVFIGAVSMPFSGYGEWPAALASCSALCELIAVVLFTMHMGLTFRSSAAKCEPYIAFIFTALAWFVLSSLINLCLTFGLMTTTGAQRSFYLDVCQPILRDMQFHGLGMTMILGVSLRTLPGLFGLPGVAASRAVAGLALLTAGVAGEIAALVITKLTGFAGAETILAIARIAILLSALLVVLPFQLWRPFPEWDRVEKYIRAAYLWLFVSLCMLAASPFYAQVSGTPASHAYAGAVRHAITVGFISLMIMGYSSKVVPTLKGVNPATLSPINLPFFLVNLGCALRVILQTGTDWTRACFPLVGISGSLEVLGIALWAIHLLRIGLRKDTQIDQVSSLPRPDKITADLIVAQVLNWYPQTESIFISNGFTALKNPILRKTVASQVSIERACRMHNVNAGQFVDELNASIGSQV
jgi:hypothetical protein